MRPVPKSARAPGVSKGESAIAFPPCAERLERGDDLFRPRRVGIGLWLQGMEQRPDARHFPLLAALLPEKTADLAVAVLEKGDLDVPLRRVEAVVGFRQELLVGKAVHQRQQMTSLRRKGQHLVVRELVAARVGDEVRFGDLSQSDVSPDRSVG